MTAELKFEASELGFAPGHWPETFVRGADTFSLTCICHRNNVVEYSIYVCVFTTQMAVVFND